VVAESRERHYDCDERALVYLTGYVVFKCSLKTSCTECIASIQTEKALIAECDNAEIDMSFIDQMSRGSLKYPSYLLLLLLHSC